MKVNIESYPHFKAIGLVWHGKIQNGPKEIPQFWDRVFLPRVNEIKNSKVEEWGSANSYGIMKNFDMVKNEMDYLAGVEVESAEKVPEGMVVWEVPTQTYAVVDARLSELPELFKTFEDWFLQSGYKRISGAPEFELYSEEFHREIGKGFIKYFIPIEKAEK